jgi:hypothetical protein
VGERSGVLVRLLAAALLDESADSDFLALAGSGGRSIRTIDFRLHSRKVSKYRHQTVAYKSAYLERGFDADFMAVTGGEGGAITF